VNGEPVSSISSDILLEYLKRSIRLSTHFENPKQRQRDFILKSDITRPQMQGDEVFEFTVTTWFLASVYSQIYLTGEYK